MWTLNFQMFKLDLEKAEEPEIKLPTSIGSLKKQENSRKTSTSVLLITPKPLTLWTTTNSGKFLKGWEYLTAWPASWEICMVRKQQLKLDMEQQTGSKLGKENNKPVYCYPVYLTSMQSSVQFSHSLVPDSLQPHESQHARPPCPSPTPSMQSISYEMLGWMNHKLESRLPGEISTTSHMQMIPPW